MTGAISASIFSEVCLIFGRILVSIFFKIVLLKKIVCLLSVLGILERFFLPFDLGRPI